MRSIVETAAENGAESTRVGRFDYGIRIWFDPGTIKYTLRAFDARTAAILTSGPAT